MRGHPTRGHPRSGHWKRFSGNLRRAREALELERDVYKSDLDYYLDHHDQGPFHIDFLVVCHMKCRVHGVVVFCFV